MRKYNNFLRIVRIHSHVKNIGILGFKGLFLARTDGKTQTILDFPYMERMPSIETPSRVMKQRSRKVSKV